MGVDTPLHTMVEIDSDQQINESRGFEDAFGLHFPSKYAYRASLIFFNLVYLNIQVKASKVTTSSSVNSFSPRLLNTFENSSFVRIISIGFFLPILRNEGLYHLSI